MKSIIRCRAIILALALLCLNPAWASGQSQADRELPAGGASVGVLRVKTDVTGAQVIIDDKEVGRTPLTLRSIAAGTHRLTLAREGYEDHTQQVEITAQRTASLFIVMKPVTTPLPELPVEFKVMHQHRFGYCVGVLTVSAEAMDYKAEQGEDRFHIPIETLKSVSRSWGPVPGTAPGGINAATDMMAFRVEAPGRSYGFLAYKDQIGEQMSVASVKTKELFDVVYKLWTATLKSRER
ncbi:MAG: PEGA domain-containing protein [Blastocatellia bacterium]|nr:PEGA domain-containing protein [Blastocatellia bacterium]